MSASNKKFRDEVLKRDQYKCKKCKKEYPTAQLDVHFLQPKIEGSPSVLSNAETLCKKHHRELHKKLKSLEEYNHELKHFNIPEVDFEFEDDVAYEGPARRSTHDDLEELKDINISISEEEDNTAF